jgi:hypothetical protein
MYDVERLLTDLKDILTTKLNAKLTDISNEKTTLGVPLDLPQIGVDGFFFQTWDDAILNQKVGILYGLKESIADGAWSSTAEKVTLFVEVYYPNPMNEKDDGSGVRRILRYTRALKEIMQENFDENEIRSKIKVKTIAPLSFRLEQDTSADIKVGGIELETALV